MVTSKGLADEVTSTIAMNNLIAERMRHSKEKDVKRLAHECLKKLESKMDKVWNPSLPMELLLRVRACVCASASARAHVHAFGCIRERM